MDDVLTELRLATESIDHYASAQRRMNDALLRDGVKVWEQIAELRDEIHAIANRLENLTRALMAEPAEVADKIVRLADADS